MSGSGAKEERRNLRKALGDTAADAIDRCVQLAAAVDAQQRMLARDVLSDRAGNTEAHERIEKRIDGVGKWCQQNEDAATRHGEALDAVTTLANDLVETLRKHREAIEGLMRLVDRPTLWDRFLTWCGW